MAYDRVLELPMRQLPEASRARIGNIRKAMRNWGMSLTRVGLGLGVSRQYVWVILHGRTCVSPNKLEEIERLVQTWIETRREASTVGQRMRAARQHRSMTLKEAAELIGYSWVAVERWEKDVCLPKPGVLWHLRHVYGVSDDWTPVQAQETGNPPLAPITARASVSA